MDMKSVQSFPLAAKLEIESLRTELEAVKKERDAVQDALDYLHGITPKQVFALKYGCGELVAALKNSIFNINTATWTLETNADTHVVPVFAEAFGRLKLAVAAIDAALAKLDADKTGEVG